MVNSAYSSMDGRVQAIEDRTKQIPELFTMIQEIMKMLGDNGGPSSSRSAPSNGNIKKGSDKTCRTKNKENAEPKKISKKDTSPTLVQKVKTRTDRQPSKVCMSPYQCKKRRLFETNAKSSHVDEVTGGLHLSAVEVAAVKFIQQECKVNSDKILIQIGASELRGDILSSLVRPTSEDGISKWLNAQIINSYTSILNTAWEKEMELKYAIQSCQTGWLQNIGKDWIETCSFKKRLGPHSCSFCQKLVGSDMVYVPMNRNNSHWWLCVLNASKQQFQILDSLSSNINYKKEIRELRSGIHALLQAVMAQSPKLESRWSNYDVLKWDVDVMGNIPQQNDACSCGIFTIKNMKHWNGMILTAKFSQKDMETFRKKMPAELFFSPLNELGCIKDDVLAMINS